MITLFDIEPAELTTVEGERLAELETTIVAGLQTFVDVGRALLEIRDSRLYRQTFSTFEGYCNERWGFTRMRASQLISAAEVVSNLDVNNCLQIPATESQARPLTVLDPDLQRDAWQKAVDTAPNGKVTAAHVQSVVDEMTVKEPDAKAYKLSAANHAISDDPDYDGDEWYTPPEFIEAARRVFGGAIQLDPASNDEAQTVVKAERYYTKNNSGLTNEWAGKVWLNPPYSMPLIRQFVTKLVTEYETGNVDEAIIITNNSSDTGWFHDLLSRYPACFTRGRVQFWRKDHETFGTRQGQTLFYLGGDVLKFESEFGQFGQVVMKL